MTDRGRSPVGRVRLTYPLPGGGQGELPFVVGVLGDFAGRSRNVPPKLRDRDFVDVTIDTFDRAMERMSPRLTVAAPDRLSGRDGTLPVELTFRSLDDFDPERLAQQVAPLRELIALRDGLAGLRAAIFHHRRTAPVQAGFAAVAAPDNAEAGASAARWREGLAAIEAGGEAASVLVRLGEQLAAGAAGDLDTAECAVVARIAACDALLSAQVNAILHHPELQRLEALWRGLRYLLEVARDDPMVRVRILQASRRELLRDFEGALDFDLSTLWQKVYEHEYGAPGGQPFGILVGDYAFGAGPEDSALLRQIAGVAAAAHAPFLAAASPAMFGLQRFGDMTIARNLAGTLASNKEYIEWRRFRTTDDSRYMALVLPRILLRAPHRTEVASHSFAFDEESAEVDARHYLFGNPAFAVAGCIVRAFKAFRWCASIRGVEGGMIQDLPALPFETDRSGVAQRGPTEVDLSDEREKELAELGFIAVVRCKGTSWAAIYNTQSCQVPQAYVTDEANANARISTQLQYLLIASRFAHYLKVMIRDQVGSTMEPRECERSLQDWLTQYCIDNPQDQSWAERARKPLRGARVELQGVAGKQGAYEALLFIQPHLQLEGLSVGVEIRSQLEEARAGAA